MNSRLGPDLNRLGTCRARYPHAMSSLAGLDPRALLANAFGAQPGVYALLLGSGVSTGAGIPTGWGVVDVLTRRLAVAANETLDEDFDPEAWWEAHGDGQPLGYSGLLQALASTPAARRQLLSTFFEATDEEREQGLKVPGQAHHAIAELARRGTVRVIVETNFDRLVEQALTAAGVPYQVVDSPSAVIGMEPLTHAGCTVIKLHGDYARLDQLNTLEELSSYHPEIAKLLDRVLDEYGLVVSGWSGDWDVALVDAIKGTRSRRYPLFWLTRSAPGESATELISRHRAAVVPGANADDVFPDLVARLEALDDLVVPPLTQAVMLAQLKRWLPNPLEHIRLRDLLMVEVERVAEVIRERPQILAAVDPETLEKAHTELSGAVDTLVRLVATGVYLDRDLQHTDLWVEVVDRMLRDVRAPDGEYSAETMALDRYPALLVMYATVAAALGASHEDVAIRTLVEPMYQQPFSQVGELNACEALHVWRVFQKEWIDKFPSWRTSSGWKYAESHLIRHVLRPVFTPLVGTSAVTDLLSRTELRVALAQRLVGRSARTRTRPAPGEYLLSSNWRSDVENGEEHLRWITDLVDRGHVAAWSHLADDMESEIRGLEETLAKHDRW